MRRGALTVLAVVLWIGLTAGAGLAQRAGEPKKASKLELSLVRNYNDCTTPNDTSAGTISLPACHPLVPADTQCSFDPAKGQGTPHRARLPGTRPEGPGQGGRRRGV